MYESTRSVRKFHCYAKVAYGRSWCDVAHEAKDNELGKENTVVRAEAGAREGAALLPSVTACPCMADCHKFCFNGLKKHQNFHFIITVSEARDVREIHSNCSLPCFQGQMVKMPQFSLECCPAFRGISFVARRCPGIAVRNPQ